VVACVAIADTLRAADSNAAFAKALRERGWDDTAAEYLQWVETSPLAAPELAGELPYQRALSVAAQARRTRNRGKREEHRNQAASDFEKVASEQSDSPAAIDALRQAANLYAEQAIVTLEEARQLPEQATAQRDQLREKAREIFGKASTAAEKVAEITTAKIAA